MNIEDLAQRIQPNRTILLFGAGASIPSGAPSGAELAQAIARNLNPAPPASDLSEISQIFEDRKGRAELIRLVRKRLEGLEPTQGLLTLPEFGWLAIYTTNFDTLVEQAYRRCHKNLSVCRSNYEVVSVGRDEGPVLYKIHGCVTQDPADGHKSRMLITESDYDQFETYRQVLFNTLRTHMYTADTVIIGQSLSDRHLKELVKEVSSLRDDGIPGRVFLMVHDYDPDRASLFERRGVEVIHAGLEDLLRALLDAGKASQGAVYSTSSDPDHFLSPSLILTTKDVKHAATLQPSPRNLFNGSPATYADIQAGITIPRRAQRRLEESQSGSRGYFQVVTGARGVGKTSLARAVLLSRAERGMACWEHLSDHRLDVDAWVEVEKKLQLANKEGILLIDDCTRNLRETNKLVDRLAAMDRPRLRLVVTAEVGRWRVSTKAAGFFSRGTHHPIAILERGDIEALVSLVATKPAIRELVENQFLALGQSDQIRRLQNKCSSDMFVCLKNIFANDNLDQILLQEYYELPPAAQDVYRYVSAIQAMGGVVHRQLIMRVLNIEATGLDQLLGQLDGIVQEDVISERGGIYGWRTRHDVIAAVIAKWKFADQSELFSLIDSLTRGLSPTLRIELETAIALATDEGGISRLTDIEDQVTLFNKLIEMIPDHRTPRRRLVRLFLKNDRLADAEHEIAKAERAFGGDQVLARYKALLQLRRAGSLPNLQMNDRKAILQDAEGIIRRSISQHGPDIYTYRALGDVGLALAGRFNDFVAIDDAISYLQEFEERNADPEIQKVRRALQSQLRSIENGVPQDDFEVGDDAALIDL